MARNSKKLPANAFTVVQKADRWVAFGEDGQPVGMFRDRDQAQRVVDARAEVYRIVTGAKPGKAKPRADRAKTLADTSIAKAGRKLAEKTPELLEHGQKLLSFAAKPVTPPAAEASEGLTTADLDKALKKHSRPQGAPIAAGLAQRAKRASQPPTPSAEPAGPGKGQRSAVVASLESGKQIQTATTRPQATAPAAAAGGLTADDLEKALAKATKPKQPKGTPVSLSRASRSKRPPTLSEASAAVGRKQRRGGAARPPRQSAGRRAKQTDQPRAGGFVLEDPSANLSAHDLTRMLSGNLGGNLGGNPAGPVLSSQPAQPPAQSKHPSAQSPKPPAQGKRLPAPGPAKLPAQRDRARPAAPGKAAFVNLSPKGQPAAAPHPDLLRPPANAAPYDPARPRRPQSRPNNIEETIARLRGQSFNPPPIPKLTSGPGSPLKSAAGSTTAAAAGAAGKSELSMASLASMLTGLFTKLAEIIARKLTGKAASPATATSAGGASGQAPPGSPLAAGAAGQPQGGGRGFRFAQAAAKLGSRLFGGAGKPAASGAAASVAKGAAGTAARGAAGSAAAGAAGLAARAIPVAGVAIGFAALAKQLVTLPSKIEEFTGGILEGSRDLRQFNASIANSFAMLDRQQLILAGRQASATAGTAKSLAKSQASLRESTQPAREVWANMKNVFATGFNHIGTGIAESVSQLIFLRQIAEWFRGRAGADALKGPPPFQFLDQVGQGNWGMPKNQDPSKGP